jgi:hypothetical protein
MITKATTNEIATLKERPEMPTVYRRARIRVPS